MDRPTNIKTLVLNQKPKEFKRPVCPKDKANIARICTSQQCKMQNRLMCNTQECQCAKQQTHKNCTHSINYEYLKQLNNSFYDQSYFDVFQKLLKSLKDLAEEVMGFHNQLLSSYDYFSMPPTIRDVKKSLNISGKIPKALAHSLEQFFNENVGFQIPILKQNPEYKKNNEIVEEKCTKMKEEFKKIKNEILDVLISQQKMTDKIITQFNKQKTQKNKKKLPVSK